MTALRYPNMREELIELLKDLASSQTAVDEWSAFPDYGFDEWFNRIDDILPGGAEGAQGVVLKPDDVHAVAAFLSARDAVWKRLGPDASYERYCADPEWPEVVAASQQALVAMGVS